MGVHGFVINGTNGAGMTEVFVGSVGHGVFLGHGTEHHVVPVHYTVTHCTHVYLHTTLGYRRGLPGARVQSESARVHAPGEDARGGRQERFWWGGGCGGSAG